MNGADWKTMGWVEYQTTLAFWNLSHSPDGGKATDTSRLKRAMAAQSVH